MATVPTSGETVQQNSDYTRAPESLDRKPAMAPSMPEVQEPQFDPVAGLEPDPVDSVRAVQALAAGRSQDQAVQYYDVSKRSGIPVDFVANNFEEISKQVDQPDYNLKAFAQKSPNLAKWMAKNPNNFALIKDELPNEEKFQDIVNDYGWGSKLRDDMIQGFSNAALGMTRFPALMAEMRATPINLGAKFLDSDFRVSAPDIMKDNAVTRFLESARDEAVKRNPYADAEILKRIGRGEYEDAAKAATSIIVANIPNLAMAAAGPAGLAVIGANVAANKSAELQKEGVDVATAVPNALATGAVEAITEKLGTAGIIKRWETEIVKKYGQQAFKELMKSVAKNIGAAMVTEGTEEVAADVGEAFIDWSTGVNPKAFDELSVGSLSNTFLGGALSGGAYGPLSTAPLAINSHRAKLWSDNVVNTITNMGKNMESSKLLQANPQAWREKATAQLEGSANENIFIPVEQFEVLFQSEEGGVNKAVVDLDAVDSYNHAKETGGNVKIKTADFLAVAQPNGILPRAAMDITFDPEKPTSRQAQEEAEENKKIIAEMQAMEKEGVNINAEFDPIALEAMDISEPKNGKSVEQQVYEKLVATGMPAQKARANSVVYRMFQVQAKRMKNVTAQDLFARYGLNIGRARSEQAPGITREQATAMPAPTFRETFLPSLQRLQKGLIEPTPKGDTLFQFIRKLGGINKYSYTSSYKGELNRDLPKSIFRKDGLDLDTIFLRMQEAGYPVETIQDAFDLIEKEASGSPVYTVAQESDTKLDDERILYNEDLRLLNALNRDGFDFNKLQSEITALESKRSSLREQKLTTANEQELKKINKQIAKLKLEQDKMNDEIIQRIEGGLLDQEAPSGDVFLQMAGQLAETANKRELSKAEKMRKDGVDMETIRKETGWHLGRDKRWRFEISDDQAEFLPIQISSGVTNLKLSEVLKHDKLFQAYPKLKDINVVIKHQRANALVNGTWTRYSNTITLNVPSTIQENPKKEKINERLAEIRRMDEFQNVFNASGATRAEIDNFLKTPLGEEYRQLQNASRLLQDKRTKAKELSPKVMSTLLHEIQHAIQSTEGFQRGSSSSSTKRYINTLGEIEARDASDRQKLTDEQRKEQTPAAQTWPASAPKEYKSYAAAPYIDWNTIRTELPIEEIPVEIVPPEVLEKFKLGEQMTLFQRQIQKANQSELGFTYKSEQVILDKMGPSATIAQVRGILKDVKPEEIKWLGINEFLNNKINEAKYKDVKPSDEFNVDNQLEQIFGKEIDEKSVKISKEELLNFIRANDLNIKEVKSTDNLSQKILEDAENSFIVALRRQGMGESDAKDLALDIARGDKSYSEIPEGYPDSIQDLAIDLYTAYQDRSEVGDRTKFSQYTLPGGENYREVLFTLPQKDSIKRSDFKIVKNEDNGEIDVLNKFGNTIFSGNTEKEAEEYIDDTIKSINRGKDAAYSYRSPHFDESNILAHTRLNDRVDADGKRVLFVEEIQSDWHQEGRKKGYKTGKPEGLRVSQVKEGGRYFEIVDKNGEFVTNIIDDGSFRKLPVNEESALKIAEERVASGKTGYQSNAVPDAPLKKNWHEFVLKRVIRMAAEQGYDRVAWTTGKQQADRYSLSKQVGSITIGKNSSGNYDVQAYKDTAANNRGRNPLIEKIGISKQELADTLGKEFADKAEKEVEHNKPKTFEGLELDVGGEGMKGFYDKILVDYANKLGKKFGSKVSDITITAEKSYNLLDGFKGGDAKVHSLDITPQLSEAALGQGFELFQKNKTTYRGRFFKANGTFNIDLLEGENSSTFLHETGHFFMHVMMDLAEDPMASYEIKSDVQKIFDFLGVESRDQIGRDQHEKFAEAWEKYFMEGKAPAVSLESTFETFKGWMMAVYKFIRNMYPDVKMTDEIRGVFDRMLATEAEIAEARAAQSMAPMILETRGIMPDSEAAIYNKLVEDEDKAAKDNLRGQAMLNISKKVRAQREAARERITKQVTDQVNAEPDQVVYKMIKDGIKPDGTQIPGSLKMSRAMAAKLVNKETLEKLPSGLFSKDGQHPNTTAEMLGGELDGIGLLLQMANMEPAKQKIDRLIKEEMESEFPDPTQSPNFREEAIAALHNESGSERRMFELRYLINNAPASAKKMIQRIAGRRYASIDPYRTRAQIIVGQTKVSELRPSQYKRLEIKYANEAMKAFLKGDWEAAVEAKAKEITNYELYKLAHEARIEVNAQMVRFRRAFKPDEQIAKTRDMDTVMAIRGMLGRVGIGNVKEDKIASYLEKMASYDNDKDQIKVIEQLINTANVDSDSIWNATFNEFVKVKSSFNSLWEMAKELNRVDVLEGKANKSEAISSLRSQIDKFKDTKAIEEFSGSATALEKFNNGLLSFVAANRRIESWVDLMDGGNVNGPFRTYFWQPIQSAYENFISRKREVTKQIETLLTEYKDIFKEGAIQTTLIGLPDKNNQIGSKYVFKNKAELLGAMIHIGNDSNKMKLLVGNGWGSVDENRTIDSSEWDRNIDRFQKDGTLTVRDYEFLQKYWDIMEGIKPDAQRAHKKLYGYYFDEISAKEIVTPFGVFKGGYAPAIRDMERVKDITREKEQLENGTSGANMFPSSADGFTISRNPNAAQPLKMDLNLIVNHTDQVLRFSYMTPAMKDVSKLIFDRSFRNDLDSLSYKFVEKAIIPWLDRSVKQSVSTPSTYKEIDYVAKKLRANVGAGTMFLNVINTLQQFTGVIVASSKVKPKYLAHALGQFVRTPKEMSAMIHAKSKQMEIRASKQMDDSLDGINDILVNPSVFDNVKKWGKKHAYILQALAQNTVDNIVWSGAYNQSVADGLSEVDAVRAADASVRLTQGSMAAQDIAKFEAGTPAMRMVTMFGGYFNMLANLLGTEFGKVMKSETGIKNRAMKMLPLYLQIISLPAALSLAIVRLGAGEGLADDDDELYETLLKYFGLESVRTMAAATPLVGQVANMMIGNFTEQPMDDRLSLSPVIKALESAGSVPFDIYKGASNAEINKGAVKDSLSLITLLTGIPAAQVAGKPIGYLMDVESGRANPENGLDFARGLVTGRTPR